MVTGLGKDLVKRAWQFAVGVIIVYAAGLAA
jgi:hypothetical protein